MSFRLIYLYYYSMRHRELYQCLKILMDVYKDSLAFEVFQSFGRSSLGIRLSSHIRGDGAVSIPCEIKLHEASNTK